MQLSTTQTEPSKLFPEVSFTFKKFSEGRRIEFTELTSEARYKIRDLISRLPVVEEGATPTAFQVRDINTLSDQINLLSDRDIKSFLLKVYLKKIDGLEIDGEPATVESFIDNASSEMFAEVCGFIEGQSTLTLEKKVT